MTGVQGHVGYPQKAVNPIPALAELVTQLASHKLDRGSEHFDPSTLSFTSVDVGNPATNVIPGALTALFNFRYSTASTADDLKARTEAILSRHGLDYALDWNLSGEPFLTPPDGRLREVLVDVCRELAGVVPVQSTGGGTSDGRFIAPLGAEVVELGPVNATIHQVDECVAVADLEALPAIYEAICKKIGWVPGIGDERAFLEAYYTQLRARLESGMRMGKRKADKFS